MFGRYDLSSSPISITQGAIIITISAPMTRGGDCVR